MDPKVDFIASVLLAKVDDVLISVSSDIEVQQIFSHAQVLAEHHDSLIKIVHLEQGQQNVVIRFLVGVTQLLEDPIPVFFLLRGMFLHHLKIKLNQPVEDYLLMRQFRHILDKIQQEVFKVGAVDNEQPEEFIRFFEGDNCEVLEFFGWEVELLEDVPFL